MGNVAASIQQVVEAGLAPSYTGSLSTSDTYQWNNSGREILHVKKTGSGSCTVGVVTPGTVGAGSLAIADLSVTVPATTGDKMIGPFATGLYNDSSGKISVTFSEVTGLTYAVIRV